MSFELLSILEIPDGTKKRRISLYEGDVLDATQSQRVDILVISAFPNDYTPTPGSLIGGLDFHGMSVELLASNKAHDLRDTCGFWISSALSQRSALPIDRIACFETSDRADPPTMVGDLFRGLFPFLDDRVDKVVAMPILSAGDQGWDKATMLTSILDAASHWLARGLAISDLKIFFRDADDRIALTEVMSQFQLRAPNFDAPPTPPRQHDVFLSYSIKDSAAADQVYRELNKRDDVRSIFDFKLEIKKGASWQNEIDQAISSCRSIVTLLSPSYFASSECREELMQARLRHKRSKGPILFPIYWLDWGRELDLWLQLVNYSDCREGDYDRLSHAIAHISF